MNIAFSFIFNVDNYTSSFKVFPLKMIFYLSTGTKDKEYKAALKSSKVPSTFKSKANFSLPHFTYTGTNFSIFILF